MSLELISRAGCHLCDEALSVCRSLGYELIVRDVDSDPELLAAYDFRVPVVVLDGEVIAEGRVSKERLTALLSKR